MERSTATQQHEMCALATIPTTSNKLLLPQDNSVISVRDKDGREGGHLTRRTCCNSAWLEALSGRRSTT